MGNVYSLTGNDTLVLDERVIKDFTDNSTIELSYQNDRVGISTGKDGNTVFSTNEQGWNATITIRVVRGSADDKWLNGKSIQQAQDLPSFTVINGAFSKRVGDGFGKVTYDTYTLLGGVFSKYVDTQENLVGDTEQGTAVYQITFAQAKRSVG